MSSEQWSRRFHAWTHSCANAAVIGIVAVLQRLKTPNAATGLLLSHLVTKRDHPALVGFRFDKMKGDVLVEPLKKRNALANQDRQDRIADFVRQSEPKAFTTHGAAADEPYAAKGWSQPVIHQPRKIA